jgi:hypothetical protein
MSYKNCSNLFKFIRAVQVRLYVYLRWLRIADLLVCFQTIIVRSTMVCLTLLSAHLVNLVHATTAVCTRVLNLV